LIYTAAVFFNSKRKEFEKNAESEKRKMA